MMDLALVRSGSDDWSHACLAWRRRVGGDVGDRRSADRVRRHPSFGRSLRIRVEPSEFRAERASANRPGMSDRGGRTDVLPALQGDDRDPDGRQRKIGGEGTVLSRWAVPGCACAGEVPADSADGPALSAGVCAVGRGSQAPVYERRYLLQRGPPPRADLIDAGGSDASCGFGLGSESALAVLVAERDSPDPATVRGYIEVALRTDRDVVQ
jgi:hypothetical protein